MGCRSPGRAFANNVGIQRFPKYQVWDPRECVSIWSVQVKPFSLPEFDRGRVLNPGRQQHKPLESGSPWASEAPGEAQTAPEGSVPHWDTEPWRYRRDPFPSLGTQEFSLAGVLWPRAGSRGSHAPAIPAGAQLGALSGREQEIQCTHSKSQHSDWAQL